MLYVAWFHFWCGGQMASKTPERRTEDM